MTLSVHSMRHEYADHVPFQAHFLDRHRARKPMRYETRSIASIEIKRPLPKILKASKM